MHPHLKHRLPRRAGRRTRKCSIGASLAKAMRMGMRLGRPHPTTVVNVGVLGSGTGWLKVKNNK
jgi:hypothetical protein